MNLPNKLTVLRILLVPVFIIIGYVGVPGELWGISNTLLVMDLIFIIASITDKLDGTIARKYNLVTNFGKFLDPIADKILVAAALIMLTEMGKIPAWIPIIVIFREFAVSGFRLIAVEQGGKVIAASVWGKLKTATQMVAITLIFLDKFNFFQFIFRTADQTQALQSSALVYMSTGEYILNIVTSVLLAFSTIACIFSGWDYLKSGKDFIKDK
jgi:CDP-diacylglycerol--glycerol-3-phosphate 3-phosphatidyltransferase